MLGDLGHGISLKSVQLCNNTQAMRSLSLADKRKGVCMSNQEKLDILNQLEVADWDCDGDDLVYVIVENTEHNREVLKSIGATDEDFKQMGEDDDLNIALFAFEKCGANYFRFSEGFGID